MSELVTATISDLRSGRQTWRVRLLLVVPAFVAGLGAGLLRL